jgi:microcystin-dependent protein
MAEPFVGEIRMFAGNFPPRGWAFCDGQLLAVSQNDALFSLLGTIYGGDGRTTFGLPDLRGRVPIHAGTGPGLPDRRLGSKGGADGQSATATQVTSSISTDRGVAVNESTVPLVPSSGAQHPRLAINFIIALFGIYPSRN